MNRLPEGLEVFRRALKDPRARRSGDTPALVASLHSNLANALAQTGDYAAAADHYRAAIALAPKAGKGSDQFNLGLMLEQLGQAELAVGAYREAIEVNSELLVGHLQLARVLRGLGRTQEARAAYDDALRIRPGESRIYEERQAMLDSDP